MLLPNLLLIAGAAVAIYWSVSRAFKPLHKLTQAVERRSPRDLSPIDEQTSPAEVRPLVRSLNRLFSLMHRPKVSAALLLMRPISCARR